MGRRLRWKAYQPPSRAANVAAINADHSAPGRDRCAWRSTISAVVLVASERMELPVAAGPAPREDVTSGAASVVGVEDGDGDSGTDVVGADVDGFVASVDAGVVAGVTDRGSGGADRVVGDALADAGNVVGIAYGGTVETVAGTPHLGRGRTLGGSAVGREMTDGVVGMLTSGIDVVDAVDWGTVDWGTVDWATVDWATVDWGTVDEFPMQLKAEADGGGQRTASSIPFAEETPTGSALPSTNAITSSGTASHDPRPAARQNRSTDPPRRPMWPACAGSLVLTMDPGRVPARTGHHRPTEC
jgi:hypothetical protein